GSLRVTPAGNKSRCLRLLPPVAICRTEWPEKQAFRRKLVQKCRRPSAAVHSGAVHLQHGLDGAPYISASIDYARDAKSGFTNIGCRRLMLRGPRAAGMDLNAPRDLLTLDQTA